MSIAGKKILLISNHGFSKQISEEIKSLDGEVIFVNDKPNDGLIAKTLGRVKFKPYIRCVLEKYYSNIIDDISEETIDYILVIRGEYTPIGALKKMRKVFPNANMVLYMWDSIINNRGIEKKWSYYDEVWTFDRKDYCEHKECLKFRPLFYCEKLLPDAKNQHSQKYDLAFVGTGHEDRIAIIKEIDRQCKDNGLKFFYYIYVPHIFVYYYNKIFNKHYKYVRRSDVNFELMPLDEVYRIYSNSKCILDVESSTQTGLTMRTTEIVGIKKKLMTTNKDIINYDFYSANNIFVFERTKGKISKDFFDKEYKEIPKEIYDKYSLKFWVLEVLGEKKLEGFEFESNTD